MDFKEIVTMALEECDSDLMKALNSLTAEERRHQPTPECNHIDFIVWHMAIVEDGWIQLFARGIPLVWERDGWGKKLGLPDTDWDYEFTAEEAANLPRFDFDDLLAYYDAVRAERRTYLAQITASDLDVCPNRGGVMDYTVGNMFSHLIVEESQHLGQIAYLRGIHRGINK